MSCTHMKTRRKSEYAYALNLRGKYLALLSKGKLVLELGYRCDVKNGKGDGHR